MSSVRSCHSPTSVTRWPRCLGQSSCSTLRQYSLLREARKSQSGRIRLKNYLAHLSSVVFANLADSAAMMDCFHLIFLSLFSARLVSPVNRRIMGILREMKFLLEDKVRSPVVGRRLKRPGVLLWPNDVEERNDFDDLIDAAELESKELDRRSTPTVIRICSNRAEIYIV
jgi:hypothetical protein